MSIPRTVRHLLTLAGVALVVILVLRVVLRPYANVPTVEPGSPFAEIEEKLKPLATRLGTPLPGEWLHRFPERGQSFAEYRRDVTVRRTAQHNTIYLCLVGDFTNEQERILDVTRDYLAIFFDVPVKIRKRMKVDDLPAKAQRRHPSDGHHQLLTLYFLNERLKEDRPDDALAYVAFSAVDLWTRDNDGNDWNFVFGQADIHNRLGVWSLARFGDPAKSPEEYHRCLKLTMGTATHETGHVLGLLHCVYHKCNMNGSNHLDEAMKAPLHLCPMCLRKLCWNLQVEPKAYLERLRAFAERHELAEDVEHYRRAVELLQK